MGETAARLWVESQDHRRLSLLTPWCARVWCSCSAPTCWPRAGLKRTMRSSTTVWQAALHRPYRCMPEVQPSFDVDPIPTVERAATVGCELFPGREVEPDRLQLEPACRRLPASRAGQTEASDRVVADIGEQGLAPQNARELDPIEVGVVNTAQTHAVGCRGRCRAGTALRWLRTELFKPCFQALTEQRGPGLPGYGRMAGRGSLG